MKSRKLLVLPLLASMIAFFAFLRTPGSDAVRPVQILALLATGVGLGVVLAHVKLLLGLRSQ